MGATARDRESHDSWYREGLRFECTQCGNCCSGPPGAVWFDVAEGEAIARLLGISVDAFHSEYARQVGVRWSLAERVTEHGNDCIFLDRSSTPGKALCSIYEARPSQCRTWPFWDANLVSREVWEGTKARVPCPGMDARKGRLYRVEEIRILRGEDERRSELPP